MNDNIKELIKDRYNAILLRDAIAYIRMVKEVARDDALKIGFLEEKVEENIYYYCDAFDVVSTDNITHDELVCEVRILRRKGI